MRIMDINPSNSNASGIKTLSVLETRRGLLGKQELMPGFSGNETMY
jgi:hypothetical protein